MNIVGEKIISMKYKTYLNQKWRKNFTSQTFMYPSLNTKFDNNIYRYLILQVVSSNTFLFMNVWPVVIKQ